MSQRVRMQVNPPLVWRLTTWYGFPRWHRIPARVPSSPHSASEHDTNFIGLGSQDWRRNMVPRQTLNIFYDGDCGFCTATAHRWRKVCARRGFMMTPIGSGEARKRCGLLNGEVPEEMKVETRDGRVLGGVDGVLYVMRRIWWAWPMGAAGMLPGVHAVLAWRYRRFAMRRNCRPRASDGGCR